MTNLKLMAKTRLSQIQRKTAKIFGVAMLMSALAYSQGTGQVLTGYFPEWGPSNGFTPNRLDPYVVSRLNYLIYAFAAINGDSCQLTDPTNEPTTFQQLKTLKANNPNLRVLLSIGGQNSDGPLQAATANGNASSFAGSCISNFFTAYPGVFDGIDIDWEYPTSADTSNFTALVEAFHTQLGSGAIVTAAIGVTPAQYGNIQFSTVSKYINYFSVMGYDVAADTVTTFNAPLYNSFISGGQDTWNGTVDAAVTDLTKSTGTYKVPPGQLLLGVPFYGMKWTGVPDGTFPDGTSSNGFYQSTAASATQVPYSTIVTMSGTKHCDFAGTESQSCTQPSSLPTSGSQETWIYDGSNLTSFDDPISMATKVQYATAKKMGGITVWELSQDQSQDKKHELLMDSIVTNMGGAVQGNWIGAYGADGYFIASEPAVLPTYASVSLTGDATYIWAPSTSDVRALQTSGGSSRIASAYYSSTGFSINVNITDGNIHRVALYLLNWDSNVRSETISIVNAVTNAVLDTQTFSSFHNGEYAAWNIQGQVRIQVTNVGGPNALVSGIFFGPGSPSASAMFTGPD
jgi:GH18 family chitinase